MAWKRQEIAARTRPVKDHELERHASIKRHGLSFAEALKRDEGLAVIAEIKRRSPAAGAIAELTVASEQARKYYNSGADAMSILTDEKYFGGTIKDLWEVNDLLANRTNATPTLRKDFFVHPIQVLEAAEAGARAILIIVRALTDDEMAQLRDAAALAGMDALFEIHAEDELERAVEAGAQIIGVNNRDLARFVTDLSYSERLIPLMPSHCIAVSESGIKTLDDAARVYQAGADAVLIGETLMKMANPESFIRGLHDL
ncbi:MAG: indole-3-glycerol phosphate synthase TrpC [Verrucomicrobia bacterium]|nr:indole-3-glycerol phosphate synthase TrpC [Verrucomicrobiota bacterium]